MKRIKVFYTIVFDGNYIGIRDIRQTQLDICYYMSLYSFIKATCFDLLKGSSSGRGLSVYIIIRRTPT
jgi:hypothetical protein